MDVMDRIKEQVESNPVIVFMNVLRKCRNVVFPVVRPKH